MSYWHLMKDIPGDGESIWLEVLEWDQQNYHVDYAVVFYDVDGVVVKRFEKSEYEIWPPSDASAWMPCSMPKPKLGGSNQGD